MVNPRLRFFAQVSAAALVSYACSDDAEPSVPPLEDAAARADSGTPEAGVAAPDQSEGGSPDAASEAPNGDASTRPFSTSDELGDAASPVEEPITSAQPSLTAAPVGSEPGDSSDPVAPATAPGNLAFATDQILDVAVTLSETNLQNLEEHGNTEAYLPGSVTISGGGFDTYSAAGVGVRHKGSYSLHHCWVDNVRNYEGECAKLSLKLKFDEFADGQRFDGLKRLNLHASSGDQSKLRELLAYNTFADFGVDAPRISIARVSINGEIRGLFFAVEELDGRYAAAHYPDGPEGNLYKEIWPVEEQTEEAYVAALETNDNAPNVSDIRGFAEAIDEATVETFLDDMGPWIDVDDVLRYLVVDRAIKNWDGIMAFYDPIRPHNFFWYHDTGPQSRFHLIPWDLDNTFWATDPYMAPQEWALNVSPVPDWNVTPLNCEPRPVWDLYSGTYITPPRCDKFLDLLARTQWQRFVELGTAFREQILESPAFQARLDHWKTLLAPLVNEDPTLDAMSVASDQSYLRDIIEDLNHDFGLYMERGLREEYLEPGPVLLPEPTEEELSAVTPPRGIEPGRVTNFEFAIDFETPDGGVSRGTEPQLTSETAYASPTNGASAAASDASAEGARSDAGPMPVTSPPDAALSPSWAGESTELGTSGEATPSPPLPYSDVAVSPYSTAAASLNTVTPIFGDADARIDFTHYSTPGAYNEWVNLFLYMNDGVVDVTGYTQIEMTLRADKFRYVRVRVGGAAAGEEFGGAWDEFGVDFAVDTSPTHVVLHLHDLTYPEWAKAAWEEGQGWTVDDAVARERFLATMWGLIFLPGADVDDYGELNQSSDTGYLQIDNVFFR